MRECHSESTFQGGGGSEYNTVVLFATAWLGETLRVHRVDLAGDQSVYDDTKDKESP